MLPLRLRRLDQPIALPDGAVPAAVHWQKGLCGQRVTRISGVAHYGGGEGTVVGVRHLVLGYLIVLWRIELLLSVVLIQR